jgi:hypothetical protein
MSAAFVLAVASPLPAEPPEFVPGDDVFGAYASLAPAADIETFGIVPASDVAVATVPSPTDRGRSVLRCARGGEAAHEIELSGRALGLTLSGDGDLAYAIVRASDRKGRALRVELVRIELTTLHVTLGSSLPATARGLALGSDGASLLVACRDEIRTFRIPQFESGPLYGVPGENVGVAAIEGTTDVLVARPSEVVRVNLAGPQGRDGLVVSRKFSAPTPLRAMMAATGAAGPIALAEDGHAWRVNATAPPPLNPRPAERTPEPPPEPRPEETPAPPASSGITARHESVGGLGTVSGAVTGPARAEVAVIVVLGPDNLLREAARVVPDGEGRFLAPSLPPGGYRVVAVGKGGHVLICDPPFITIRVDPNGAVETPVLNVLRAQ